jgi:hypothetical protein
MIGVLATAAAEVAVEPVVGADGTEGDELVLPVVPPAHPERAMASITVTGKVPVSRALVKEARLFVDQLSVMIATVPVGLEVIARVRPFHT